MGIVESESNKTKSSSTSCITSVSESQVVKPENVDPFVLTILGKFENKFSNLSPYEWVMLNGYVALATRKNNEPGKRMKFSEFFNLIGVPARGNPGRTMYSAVLYDYRTTRALEIYFENYTISKTWSDFTFSRNVKSDIEKLKKECLMVCDWSYDERCKFINYVTVNSDNEDDNRSSSSVDTTDAIGNIIG